MRVSSHGRSRFHRLQLRTSHAQGTSWGQDRRPRQADIRRQAREPRGSHGPHHLRQGGHLRQGCREEGHGRVRRRGQLRRREPCRQEHHIPRGLRHDRRHRRVHAPRGGQETGREEVRADIHGRGVRLDRIWLVLREGHTRPVVAVFRQQGGRGAAREVVCQDLRARCRS